VEATALEACLARADRAQVGVIEAAIAEDAPPAGREQGLETAVERLSAEIAVLEGAALRREGVEGGAPEVGVTDRDAVEHEDARNGVYGFATRRVRRTRRSARRSRTGARPSVNGPRRRRPSRSRARVWGCRRGPSPGGAARRLRSP